MKNTKLSNTSQQENKENVNIIAFFRNSISYKQQIAFNALYRKSKGRFSLKMTHNQIADFVGCSARTAQRAIKLFESKDWIRVSRSKKSRNYNAPNMYTFNQDILKKSFFDWLDIYFRNVVFFGLILLASKPAAARDVQPNIYNKEEYILERELETKYGIYTHRLPPEDRSFKSLFLKKRLPSSDPVLDCWQISACQTRNQLPSEVDFCKEKGTKPMEAWTLEQLEQIKQFPQEVVASAHRKLQEKRPLVKNAFAYFMAICKSEMSKREAILQRDAEAQPAFGSGQYSQNGKAWARSTQASSLSVQQAKFRSEEQYHQWTKDRNEKKHSDPDRFAAKPKETPQEFALNYERLIHERTQKDAALAKKTAKFDACPVWTLLNPEEQRLVWEVSHPEPCSCRKNSDSTVLLPEIAKNLYP